MPEKIDWIEVIVVTLCIMGLVLMYAGAGRTQPATVSDLDTFVYPATVENVYDGDTLTVDITWAPQLVADDAKLRLFGINTPEIRTRDADEKVRGYAARDFLRAVLDGRPLRVQLIRGNGKRYTGKYGLWLARLWIQGDGTWCAAEHWCDVNAHLVKTGHAAKASY